MVDRTELTGLIVEFEREHPRLVGEFRDRMCVAVAQPDPRERQQSVDPQPIEVKLTGKLDRKRGLATRLRRVAHSEGEPSRRDESFHTLRRRPFPVGREQTLDPATTMLETSSREPETLEQSRGSQTERRIGLAGIFECRIEFALFALESVVPALGIRASELERRLKQRVKVSGPHAGMLRAVLPVILSRGEWVSLSFY